MKTILSPAPAPKGRPREFDADQTLDRAMHVFWRKGYLGATLSDLTAAMGINRPSLYAAFGNKEALFRKALNRYAAGSSACLQDALGKPTAYGVAEQLLRKAVDLLTNPKTPVGCLWVHGALSCGDTSDPLSREIAASRVAREAEVRKRFKRAVTEGDLPSDADPAALARYVGTINLGLAVQASTGATRAELLRVVETVLRGWPTSGKR